MLLLLLLLPGHEPPRPSSLSGSPDPIGPPAWTPPQQQATPVASVEGAQGRGHEDEGQQPLSAQGSQLRPIIAFPPSPSSGLRGQPPPRVPWIPPWGEQVCAGVCGGGRCVLVCVGGRCVLMCVEGRRVLVCGGQVLLIKVLSE